MGAETSSTGTNTVFDFLNSGLVQSAALAREHGTNRSAQSKTAPLTGQQRVQRLDAIENRLSILQSSMIKFQEGIVRNDCKTGSAALLRQLRERSSAAEREISDLQKERAGLAGPLMSSAATHSNSSSTMLLGRKGGGSGSNKRASSIF